MSKHRVPAWLALALLLAACGEPIIAPARVLTRPSALAVVSQPNAGDTSPEFLFVVDSDLNQLIMVDTVAELIRDLHPEIPGFNGVFLGGRPIDVAARPDGTQVVVSNFGAGTLQLVCTPIAGEACETPHLVGTIPVGPAPEKVLVAGNRAYVTRPDAGIVVVADLDTAQVVTTLALGGNPRGLALSPDGARIYVGDSELDVLHKITVATGEVGTISVGAPTREIFVSPNPEYIFAVRADRGTILIVDPRTETVIDTNPDSPSGTGPELEVPGLATGIAFQSFEASESATIGAGQYGFVTSTQGAVYVITAGCPEPVDPECVSRQGPAFVIRDRSPPATPAITLAPSLTIGSAPLAINSDVAQFIGLQSDGFGITLAEGRVIRNEGWSLTYEGVISEASVTRGVLEADGTLVSRDVRFSELTIFGSDEKMLRDGDEVVFLDPPFPAAGVDCSQIEFDEDGQRRRWELQLVPERPEAIRIVPQPEAGSLVDCYTQGEVAYQVRVPGTWAVVGTLSGFQGRARECPHDFTETECLGSGYEYANPFFKLTVRGGLLPSLPDMRWAFALTDGVDRTSITLETIGSSSGLPRAVTASSRPDRRVFVIDEGVETITFISAADLMPVKVLR